MGGFLLVPLLLLLPDISQTQAITIALIAYIPSGILGSLPYYRRKQIDWKLFVIVFISSLPGLYMGLKWSHNLTQKSSQVILGIFLLVASVVLLYQLYRMLQASRGQVKSGNPLNHAVHPLTLIIQICSGFIAGVFATLSGVGGALIIVPVVIAFGTLPAIAAGTGIVVSTGIAVLGIAGYLFYVETIPFFWTISIVVLFSVGTVVGARGASAWSKPALTSIIIVLCSLSGLNFLLKG